MSRGFVKEGDQEEVPLVTPRAFLPAGVENFVTSAGLAALNEEREAILAERKPYEGVDNNDARVNNNYDPARQKDIAFGATVEYKELRSGRLFKYQIVGVDESNITKGKISFLSPLSKTLMNKKVGDIVYFDTPRGALEIKILSIT